MQKSKVLVNILYAVGEDKFVEQQQLSPYSYQIYPKQRKVGNVAQDDHTGHVMGLDNHPIRLTAGRGRHYLYFRKDNRVEWVLISKEAHASIGQGNAFRVEPAEAEVVVVKDESVPAPTPEPVAPVESPAEEPAEEPDESGDEAEADEAVTEPAEEVEAPKLRRRVRNR